MEKLLIFIPLEAAVLLVSSFGIFAAKEYLTDSDDKPARIFIIAASIIGYLIGIIFAIGVWSV